MLVRPFGSVVMSFARISQYQPVRGELQPDFFIARICANVRDFPAPFGVRAEAIWIVHEIPQSPAKQRGMTEEVPGRREEWLSRAAEFAIEVSRSVVGSRLLGMKERSRTMDGLTGFLILHRFD